MKDRNDERRASMDTKEGPTGRQDAKGDNRGKGPRSYTRSDDRILDEINDRLCDNPYLDASEMEIGVKDGDIILTGIVESREDKRLAEDIAESVTGVNNVENRLRIRMKGI